MKIARKFYPVQIDEAFEYLTVIRESAKRGNHRERYVFCNCKCGNKNIEIKASALRLRPKTSCGCRKILSSRLAPKESAYNELEQGYRGSAKKRNHVWTLTQEEFRFLISQHCHYCGVQPRKFNHLFNKNGDRVKSRSTMSITNEWASQQWILVNGIDRVINTVGYSKENCVPCCGTCNFAKHKSTYEEFIDYLNKVANYRAMVNKEIC